MRQPFRNIDDVFQSPFLQQVMGTRPLSRGGNRVLKSTRLEDGIYADLRRGDDAMDALEQECAPKLSTFPDLSRDIYQSFYSLNVRKQPEEALSDSTRRLNAHLVDGVMQGDEYPTIKSVCEGRKLPAYEAASEFTASVAGNLEQLLQEAGGDQKALDTLEKLEQKRDNSMEQLRQLLEAREKGASGDAQDQQLIAAANKAESQCRQAAEVGRMVRDNLMKNGDQLSAILSQAISAAKGKAEDTALALAAWGTGDTDDSPAQIKLNMELLAKVRQSPTLCEIARYLGRFREMLAKARKNGYAYGLGEKYSLELGGSLSRALSSEFALLATPETLPLFLRKVQRRTLKQYQRREPIYKGSGDIICCLDESGSARGDAPWGKAVALTLLDAAMAGNRKFALVHFSSANQCKTDLFLPGQYTSDDVFAAAETFLGGNTDYETPMLEALRLMEQKGFGQADMVFITDGACALPEHAQAVLREKQAAARFTITGVLLDQSAPGFSFSLEAFCDEIYRTNQLTRDAIVASLLSKRT